MSLGLAKSTLEQSITTKLGGAVRSLSSEDVTEIARVLAEAIEDNNRQVERDLGWKFANLERFSARG
jgi:hypothetical protein